MIRAARRGRAAARQPAQEHNHLAAASQEPSAAARCHAAARQFAAHAARTAEQLSARLAAAAHAAAATAAPLLALEQPQQQRQLLLASVSGSALEQQQQPAQAFLPDRRRSGRRPCNPAVGDIGSAPNSGGGEERKQDPLTDADENERFLVSEVGSRGQQATAVAFASMLAAASTAEALVAAALLGAAHTLHPNAGLQVDVVGVEGELRDVALAALNTRANFAYSLKEVGRAGNGSRGTRRAPRAACPPRTQS